MLAITVKSILIPIAVLGGIGFIFGILISVLSKVFYVEVDNREEEVAKMLPGYNCGACGYSGCHGLAHAIIHEGASVDKCRPIKQDQVKLIKEFLASQGKK